MTLRMEVEGLTKALPVVERVRGGAEALGRLRGVVGSSVRYAPFQEFGTSQMAGRFYLTKALIAVLPQYPAQLAAAVLQGRDAVVATFERLLFDVQRHAQREAPVRTGRLRGSLHTRLERR